MEKSDWVELVGQDMNAGHATADAGGERIVPTTVASPSAFYIGFDSANLSDPVVGAVEVAVSSAAQQGWSDGAAGAARLGNMTVFFPMGISVLMSQEIMTDMLGVYNESYDQGAAAVVPTPIDTPPPPQEPPIETPPSNQPPTTPTTTTPTPTTGGNADARPTYGIVGGLIGAALGAIGGTLGGIKAGGTAAIALGSAALGAGLGVAAAPKKK